MIVLRINAVDAAYVALPQMSRDSDMHLRGHCKGAQHVCVLSVSGLWRAPSAVSLLARSQVRKSSKLLTERNSDLGPPSDCSPIPPPPCLCDPVYCVPRLRWKA